VDFSNKFDDNEIGSYKRLEHSLDKSLAQDGFKLKISSIA